MRNVKSEKRIQFILRKKFKEIQTILFFRWLPLTYDLLGPCCKLQTNIGAKRRESQRCMRNMWPNFKSKLFNRFWKKRKKNSSFYHIVRPPNPRSPNDEKYLYALHIFILFCFFEFGYKLWMNYLNTHSSHSIYTFCGWWLMLYACYVL